MKTLIDGSEVVSRTYYYLLDWNEQDEWKRIYNNYGVKKLNSLTKEQYKELFMFATMYEPTIFN